MSDRRRLDRPTDPRIRIASIAAMIVFVLDQVTKAVVQQEMTLHDSIPLLPFASLTYVRNPGAAFGLFGSIPAGVRLPLLIGVTGFAFWVLVGLVRETPRTQRGLLAAIGAVMGGAAGNLVCRIRYGEVIDFLHLHWAGWSWPMFNVADSAITVGVVAILLSSLLAGRQTTPSP